MKLHCAGVSGGSDEMAAVVVRAEAQELVVDLVQRPGSTSPSTLPSFAQSGRGGKVCLVGLPSMQAWHVRSAWALLPRLRRCDLLEWLCLQKGSCQVAVLVLAVISLLCGNSLRSAVQCSQHMSQSLQSILAGPKVCPVCRYWVRAAAGEHFGRLELDGRRAQGRA